MTTHPAIPTVRITPPRRVNDRVTAPVHPEATVMDMPSAEAEYVLRTVEERGIRFIRLWFTDVLGFLKSFTITSQKLEGAFADGMGFDGSSIEGLSRLQESDMIAVPAAAPFQLIPWTTEQPAARTLCDVREPAGSPVPRTPPR